MNKLTAVRSHRQLGSQLYAVVYGARYFAISDYVYTLFFKVPARPDSFRVADSEMPRRDIVTLALEEGEREVCVHVRSTVSKYEKSGPFAATARLFAFMHHAVDSTVSRLQSNVFGPSDPGKGFTDYETSRAEQFCRRVELTRTEVEAKYAERRDKDQSNYRRHLEEVYGASGVAVKSLLSGFQFSVVRELLHNTIESICVGPNYITQTY
jgi:hypothetical protein